MYFSNQLTRSFLSTTLLIFLSFAALSNAQDPELGFAFGMGDTGGDIGVGIAVDDSGNIYTTGAFFGTVDFDPGAGTAMLTSAGNDDIFVQKVDAAGNLVWARAMGGTGGDRGYGIAVGTSGSVYVTGYFQDMTDFDPGPGTAIRNSAGGRDAFVQKLDSDGNFIWAWPIGGATSDEGFGVGVDASENVYTSGKFRGTADFDPSGGVSNLTSEGLNDIFVQKLDSSGNFLWARSMGSTGDDESRAIAVSAAGNVFMTGIFAGTVDFDPGAGMSDLSSNGSSDIFVHKMDASGILVWARAMGNTGADVGNAIAVDTAGNVYTTGVFQNTVDFDPEGGTNDLTSLGGNDVFVQKLNSSGSLTWARAFGNGGNDIGRGVAVDLAGGVYTTGRFNVTVDFDPGAGTTDLTSAGGDDIFVQKLDASGAFVWARIMGGSDFDRGLAIAVDAAASVCTTGSFSVTADLDPNVGVTNLISAGLTDIFVQKMTTDMDGPTADTITPATMGPTNATSVDFTVTFNESVVGFDAESDLVIDHTGTSHSGVSISGGPVSYTVSVTGLSGNGTFTLAADIASSVQDTAGNALASSVTSAAVTLDNTAPAVAIGAPSASVTMGGPVSYPITYTDADSVNLLNGDITLNTTGTATGTVNVSGGTTNTPTVTLSAISGDGTLSINIAAATATDSAGNSAGAAGPSTAFSVDNVAPTLTIGAPSSALTSNTPVTYGVTYMGADTINLTTGDITLNSTGTATGSVSVSGGTTATPTVTVSGLGGSGTLSITINSGTATDSAGNSASAAGPSTSFTVDNSAPTVSIGTPSASLTMGDPVSYLVSYSGADTINLMDGDVTLNTTGTASGTVSVSNGSTAMPTVTVSTINGDGTLSISIASGTANDAAGNNAGAAGPSTSFTVDNSAPTVSIGTPSASLTMGDPVSYLVSYSGADTVNLMDGDVTLNTTGTASGTVSVSNGSTATPTVTVSTINGDGTLSISIASGTATDDAGNSAGAAGPSNSFTVDNSAPTLSIGVPSVNLTTGGPVTFSVSYTGANTVNLTVSDIALVSTGTATGTAMVANGTTTTPTVTVSSISGDGTLAIGIGAGTAFDSAGNVAAAGGPSTAFMVDNTDPVATLDPLVTSNTTPTLTGTVVDATSVGLNVTVDGQAIVAEVSAGTWTATVPAALAEGVYAVILDATDEVGNTFSDTIDTDLTIDFTAPVVQITPLVTNVLPPTLSGTVEDANLVGVDVTVDGATYPADITDGTWSVVTTDLATAGIYEVMAVATDGAGSTGNDSTTNELTVDTTAPVVTVNPLTTGDETPVLSGTVMDDTAVTLVVDVDGTSYAADVSGSSWSVTVSTPLENGTYDVSAMATDAAGNMGQDDSTDEITVNTMVPLVTFNALLTDNPNPPLTGTATSDFPITTVVVTVNGSAYNATLSGDTWTATITETLAEGGYDVTVMATNSETLSNQETFVNGLQVDFSGPAITVNTLLTNTSSPTLTGTLSDASTIATFSVEVGGSTYTPIVDGNGWAVDVTATLSDGVYEVVATATDAAGNMGTDDTTTELGIDTVAPTALELVRAMSANTNAQSVDFTVTFSESVSGVDPSDFTLRVDGEVQTPSETDKKAISGTPLAFNISGSGDVYTISVDTGSGDGSIGLRLDNDGTIQDAAGNTLTDGLAGTDEYHIDKTPPMAAITSIASNTTNLEVIPVIINFTEQVTGFDAGDVLVSNGSLMMLGGDGKRFRGELIPALDGLVTATVAANGAQDAAGNSNPQSTPFSITYLQEGQVGGEGEGEVPCLDLCTDDEVDVDGDGLTACVEACIGTSDTKTDTEGDGIPDTYEFEFGLDPVVNDAMDDLDGDDFTNLEEFLANSDPSDPRSPDGTLFVATDGSDITGTGTKTAPLRSIGFALEQATPLPEAPARIVIESGVYVEDLVLRENAIVSSAAGDAVTIMGTIVGASRSALRGMTVMPAGDESFLLDMNDVTMKIQNVAFVGTPARDVTAILIDGMAPADSLIGACTFMSLGVGLDIGGEIPTIRRCIFGDIPAEFGDPLRPGAGIILRDNDTMSTTAGVIGDATNPGQGRNDFLDTIEGFAVINERTEAILMQNNFWGVTSESEVLSRVSGPATFVPILVTSSAILASTVFCTVWNETDQKRITDAALDLTVSSYKSITDNTDGVYAFPAIQDGEYTLTIRSPGFRDQTETIAVDPGELLSVTIPMALEAQTPVGEGEGEGEGEGGDDGGCNGSKIALGKRLSQGSGDLFLIGLTLVTLLGWGFNGRTA